MYIDTEHKYVFICTPRTACRSTAAWLKKHFQPKRIRGGGHRAWVPRPGRIGERWTVFAGIRHPLDRLVSFYHLPELIKTSPGDRGFSDFAKLIARNVHAIQFKGRLTPYCNLTTFWARMNVRLTHVVRYESLIRDIELLPFAGKTAVKLGNVYASQRKLLSEYYADKETLGYALEWAWDDFENFGYEPTIEAAMRLRGEL